MCVPAVDPAWRLEVSPVRVRLRELVSILLAAQARNARWHYLVEFTPSLVWANAQVQVPKYRCPSRCEPNDMVTIVGPSKLSPNQSVRRPNEKSSWGRIRIGHYVASLHRAPDEWRLQPSRSRSGPGRSRSATRPTSPPLQRPSSNASPNFST